MPSFNDSFLMNHSCLRIKDPKISLPFYTDVLGMKLLFTFESPDGTFTLYMLGYEYNDDVKTKNWSGRQGVLELCHNHGVENDANYTINNGNGEEFRGFGHICLSVDNIVAAEQRFLSQGVLFKKKLSDGRQKDIAFIMDPDGYWIELIENCIDKADGKTSSLSYRLNHTMIRVKDPKKSLDFYKNVLGMKVISTSVHENAKFTLYFLAYDHSPEFKENSETRKELSLREGIIELTHNWGTESDPNFKGYHNGNSTENGAKQGFGHTCVSCDDPAKFCSELEKETNCEWSVKWNAGKMKNIAFLKDPDGYSIEILGHHMFEELQ